MLISQSMFREKEKPGMGHRMLFVAAIVLGLAPVSASAEGILHRASCSVVRYYVAKYSASMAEAYARSQGATEAEIEAARRCLDTRSSRVRTAQDTH
jgi:hypothetical protein